jgi:CheY-like chemotaxis protein
MAVRHKPNAILLDVRMHGMSGFEVLRELKSNASTRDIPIIIMTSKPLSAEEQNVLDSYDVPLIAKEVLCRADAREQIRSTIRDRMGRQLRAEVRS